MGRCNAGQPKAFSRNGTHGIDYAAAGGDEWTTKTEKGGRVKEGTYTAFTDAHWLGTPLVVNGALELEEPWVRQIAEPPIGRVIDIHLQYRVKRNTTRCCH